MTALPATADAVIVGGGINGAAIAFYLTRAGMRDVIILESGAAGAAASSRGAGIIRTYYTNPSEAELAVRSLAVFRNWEEEVGGSAGYSPTGFLWLASPSQEAALRSAVDGQREMGVSSEFLGADELRRLQPHLNTDGIVAIYEAFGGYGDPGRATASLHAAARRQGARLLENQAVTALHREGGRVRGVSTAHGNIEAPIVVLAAGAWSAPLAATVGIDLPLIPTRMTTGTIRHAPFAASAMTFIDASSDTFFRPVGEEGVAHISIRDDRHNTLLAQDGTWRDEPVSEAASRDGILRLRSRIPGLQASPLRAWVGPDGITPDRRAIYGPVEGINGLHLCVGGNYKGFKVAPAVGKSMADLILTGTSDIDLTAFRLSRFDASEAPGRQPPAYGLGDVA